MSRVPALSVSNCQRSNGTNSVSAEMAHETKAEMREIFKLFDLDGDGSITASELKHAMNQQGLSPSEDELNRKFRNNVKSLYFGAFFVCKKSDFSPVG